MAHLRWQGKGQVKLKALAAPLIFALLFKVPPWLWATG
jgi:hypothetical protein